MAALAGVQNAVRLLITRDDNINAIDSNGRSALMMAASRGHIGTCKLLLEAGADPHTLDREGKSALVIAHGYGHFDVVELLREPVLEVLEVLVPDIKELAPQVAFPKLEAISNSPECDGFDLSGWIEITESAPPLADQQSLLLASRIQREISAHVPIDADEDWSDVDIDLPDAKRGRRLKNGLDIEEQSAAYELFLDGLEDGSVSRRRITEIAASNSSELDEELLAHLILTLGELGIAIDEESFGWQSANDRTSLEDQSEQLATDAVAFLSDLTRQDNDPLKIYVKAFGRMALLSREEEVDLGRSIEIALDEAIVTIALCSSALTELIRV